MLVSTCSLNESREPSASTINTNTHCARLTKAYYINGNVKSGIDIYFYLLRRKNRRTLPPERFWYPDADVTPTLITVGERLRTPQ